MIDKLSLVTKDLDISTLKSRFGETITSHPYNRFYDYCDRVASKTGQHLFTIYYGPTRPTINPFKLEFNPFKLGLKYTDLKSRLNDSMDISEVQIQRVDHAADFAIPIMTAYETVRMKNKRKVKIFGEYKDGWLTGYYTGSKNEVLTVYDKAYEQKTMAFPPSSFKHVKNSKKYGELTRFELRQRYDKSPYRKLTELPFLMTYDPFKTMEVLVLKDEFKDGFEGFRRQNGIHGFQNLRKHLNKHNNFKRDGAKYFETSDLPSRLTSIYRENLGHFFEGCSCEC